MARVKLTSISSIRLPKGSNWAKVKWKGAEKGFQRALEFDLKPAYEKEVAKMFITAQESFVRDLPAQETPTMPFITGNLHDSIGSVVSSHGRVIRASYAQAVARKTSSLSGKEVYAATSGMGRTKIIGSLEAFNYVRGLQGKYPTKLAITMFVAVPYAFSPQEKGPHRGYLDKLRQFFAFALETEFRRASVRALLMMNGTLDQYIQINYDPDDIRIARESSSGRRGKGSSRGHMGAATPGMKMQIY